MTLEKCLQCPNHVSYSMGYVTCAYWTQNQQHVVTKLGDDGEKTVVGCSLAEFSLKKN